MSDDKLRKADFITSIIIILFGTWMLYEAFQMPMKDSWGGVQNVWYVSPALFPLFVGGMIVLLGLILLKIAVGRIGKQGIKECIIDVCGRCTGKGLRTDANIRFIAIVVLFVTFVYMFIPFVDFMISSLLFLIAFIVMFYLENEATLLKLFIFYCIGSLLFVVYFAFIAGPEEDAINYTADILCILFIAAYIAYAIYLIRGDAERAKRFRTALITACIAPFVLGPVFKYFLLVPLPYEGVIVELMDKIVYWEF